MKIHPVSNASCPVSDRSHPVSDGSHSAFDMCYEPLEESLLELDEDGDIIVERRHTADVTENINEDDSQWSKIMKSAGKNYVI